MQRRKRAIVVLLCMCFVWCMSFMTIFAEQSAKDALKSYDAKMYLQVRKQIKQNIEDQNGSSGSTSGDTSEDSSDSTEDEIDTETSTDFGTEGKIVSEIYNLLHNPDDGDVEGIRTQAQGKEIIRQACRKYSVSSKELVSLFSEAAQDYGVSTSIDPDNDPEIEDDLLKSATSKLNILWWEGDDTGVNRSAMHVMINKLLTQGGAAYKVMSVCTAMGAMMCLVFGIGDILEKATEKSVSTEALWRAFLKLCLGIWIIYNCLYIASAIIYIGGNVVLRYIMTGDGGTIDSAPYKLRLAIWQSVLAAEQQGGIASLKSTMASGGYGIIKQALQAAGSAVAGAVSGAYATISHFGPLKALVDVFNGSAWIQMATSFTIYAVAIEMGIRFVFTPIAVADMFSEKLRSSGIRWLKNLAACALQGTVIYVVIIVGTNLREILETGTAMPGFSPVTSTIVNLTMIGFFAKSRGFAQEAFGLH